MNAKHFNHKLVNLQQGERVDGFYQTPEGRFPSVTTVVGWKKNQFFAEWRKKNPKEAARTRIRGTKLHSLIETYLLNEPKFKDQDPYTLDLFNQIQTEIDKIDNNKKKRFITIIIFINRCFCSFIYLKITKIYKLLKI